MNKLTLLLLLISFTAKAQNNIVFNFENYLSGSYFTKANWEATNKVQVNYVDGFDENRAIIDTLEAHSGNKSLRILYPANGVGPSQSGAQAPIHFTPRKQYFISYWMQFSENFSWGSTNFGGKLPGLASGKNCSGCVVCDGTNGFTARLMWRKDGKLVLYLYSMQKENECGDDFDLLGSDNKPFLAHKGEWIHVEERVKINTGNKANGEVQIWLNGVEAIQKKGIRFVTNGDLVDNFYFSTFFGGSGDGWQPGTDCYIWFDDIAISTNRLR